MTFNFHGRLLLTTALGLAACTAVHAQGTTASIFGSGPAGAVVTAKSDTGSSRHVTINESGHYRMSPVPMGTYTVTLEKDSKVVDTRSKITLTVGRGAEIDFACENDKCAAGEG
jgi:Zn-dependent alcohol dehydrogenase